MMISAPLITLWSLRGYLEQINELMVNWRMNANKRHTTIRVRRVVEYCDFFVGESSIDISSTLKLYNRNLLVRMGAVLSLHYGNICVPDNENTLFSESSKKHVPYLNKLFKAYFQISYSPNTTL